MSSSATELVSLNGNNDIIFTLKQGADAAVDYHGSVKSVRGSSTDKDESDVTFEEVENGLTAFDQIVVTAVQATNAGTFWRLCWENPGAEFTMVYAPHGNAVADDDKPHIIGVVKTPGKRPDIGVAATRNARAQRGEFEVTLDVIGSLDLDTGA